MCCTCAFRHVPALILSDVAILPGVKHRLSIIAPFILRDICIREEDCILFNVW
uniref:Uncharacterized protein n=1 Tax=Anopheles atroparvus TaxID=41427 RepID=A0AAG5DI33_ANOAO